MNLIEACSSGNLEEVKLMLHPDNDNFFEHHTTINMAFRSAVYLNQVEVAKFLIEQGADIHFKNDDALVLASGHGCLELTKLLLENGADVHATFDLALRVACGNGCIEIVKLLVKHGADVRACNFEPHRKASMNGHSHIVNYLSKQLLLEKINAII
jgi:ankyrin repeat protein